MSDKARIRIAAAVTALFLAGISAGGLAARDGRPQPATAAAQPAVATSAAVAASDGERYEADDESEHDG